MPPTDVNQALKLLWKWGSNWGGRFFFVFFFFFFFFFLGGGGVRVDVNVNEKLKLL